MTKVFCAEDDHVKIGRLLNNQQNTKGAREGTNERVTKAFCVEDDHVKIGRLLSNQQNTKGVREGTNELNLL